MFIRRSPPIRQRRSGAALLGILLGLAIMALVVAFAMRMYETAQDKQRVLETEQELTQLVTVIHTIYPNSIAMESLSLWGVIDSKLMDKKYTDGGNNLVTPYGSPIGISSYSAGDMYVFNVTIYGLSQSECVQLITQIDMSALAIAGELNDAYYDDGEVFSSDVAEAGCTSTTNHIGWNFS